MSQQPESTPVFSCRREPVLWFAALISVLPVVLTVSLLARASPGMARTEFGLVGGLAWEGSLLLVSTVLFWPVVWLSGRYVLRADVFPDRRVNLTIWTLLGHRIRVWPGLLLSAPIVHEGHGSGGGPVLRFRALIRLMSRPLLRALVGRNYRLWQGGPSLHEGRTHIPLRVQVDAPYLSLHPVRGGLLIIDMQGDFPHGYRGLLDAINDADAPKAQRLGEFAEGALDRAVENPDRVGADRPS